MTDVVQLVRDLVRCGVDLRIDGDNIVVRPRSAVTTALRAQLVAHKSEAVALLRERPELGGSNVPPPASDKAILEHVVHQLPGSRVTLAAVDAVAIDKVFSGLRGTSRTVISRCYVCRGTSWWRLRDSGRGEPGDWFCARCHAPALAETRIERCDAAEVRP